MKVIVSKFVYPFFLKVKLSSLNTLFRSFHTQAHRNRIGNKETLGHIIQLQVVMYTVSPKIRRKIGFSSKIGKLSATISPSDAWKFQALTMAELEEVLFWIKSAHMRVGIYFDHTYIPILQEFFHSRGLHNRRDYYSLHKSSKTIMKMHHALPWPNLPDESSLLQSNHPRSPIQSAHDLTSLLPRVNPLQVSK